MRERVRVSENWKEEGKGLLFDERRMKDRQTFLNLNLLAWNSKRRKKSGEI